MIVALSDTEPRVKFLSDNKQVYSSHYLVQNLVIEKKVNSSLLNTINGFIYCNIHFC